MIVRFPKPAFALCACLATLLAVTPAFARTHHRASHRRVTHHKAHWKPGQREIDPARIEAIQTALISRKYLSGAPSGDWDDATVAAMEKFQADNGWQTRLTPDSRALIKLGLGPNGATGTAIASDSGKTLQQATSDDTLAATHTILN